MPLNKERIHQAFQLFQQGKLSPNALVKKIISYAYAPGLAKHEEKLVITKEMAALKHSLRERKEAIILGLAASKCVCDATKFQAYEKALKKFLHLRNEEYKKFLKTKTNSEDSQKKEKEFLQQISAMCLVCYFLDNYSFQLLAISNIEGAQNPLNAIEKLWSEFLEKVKTQEINLSYENISIELNDFKLFYNTFHIIGYFGDERSKELLDDRLSQRYKELKQAILQQLNIPAGSKLDWKSAIYDIKTLIAGPKQKEVTPDTHKRSIDEPFEISRTVRSMISDNGTSAIAGTTYTDTISQHVAGKCTVLDASFSSGSATSIGDGIGHHYRLSSRLNQNISRLAYFGSKHLARLANTFTNPDDLLTHLPDIFKIAASEARSKANPEGDEGTTSLVVKIFEREDNKYDVIVGSIGDCMVFALDPDTGEVTILAAARQFGKGEGRGFKWSPQSLTNSPTSLEASFQEEMLQQKKFTLNKNAMIFVVTDGAWENLPLAEKTITPPNAKMKDELGNPYSYRDASLDTAKMAQLLLQAKAVNPFPTASYYAEFISQYVMQVGEENRKVLREDQDILQAIVKEYKLNQAFRECEEEILREVETITQALKELREKLTHLPEDYQLKALREQLKKVCVQPITEESQNKAATRILELENEKKETKNEIRITLCDREIAILNKYKYKLNQSIDEDLESLRKEIDEQVELEKEQTRLNQLYKQKVFRDKNGTHLVKVEDLLKWIKDSNTLNALNRLLTKEPSLQQDFLVNFETRLYSGRAVGDDVTIVVQYCANFRKLADLRELVLNPTIKENDPFVARICAGLTEEEFKDIFMEVAQEGHDENALRVAQQKIYQHMAHFDQKKMEYQANNRATWNTIGLSLLLFPFAFIVFPIARYFFGKSEMEEAEQGNLRRLELVDGVTAKGENVPQENNKNNNTEVPARKRGDNMEPNPPSSQNNATIKQFFDCRGILLPVQRSEASKQYYRFRTVEIVPSYRPSETSLQQG